MWPVSLNEMCVVFDSKVCCESDTRVEPWTVGYDVWAGIFVWIWSSFLNVRVYMYMLQPTLTWDVESYV
jgi:hypothetical protein